MPKGHGVLHTLTLTEDLAPSSIEKFAFLMHNRMKTGSIRRGDMILRMWLGVAVGGEVVHNSTSRNRDLWRRSKLEKFATSGNGLDLVQQ